MLVIYLNTYTFIQNTFIVISTKKAYTLILRLCRRLIFVNIVLILTA